MGITDGNFRKGSNKHVEPSKWIATVLLLSDTEQRENGGKVCKVIMVRNFLDLT
jgi:hypothetical protein